MKPWLLACSLFAAVGSVSGAETNLFPNPGFESWNNTDNLPSAPKHRWSLPASGTKAFATFERSARERHSGMSSFHLQDTDRSNVNQSAGYVISDKDAARLAGQILSFSAWVKQTSAAKAGLVGIGLYLKDAQGKNISVIATVDSAGTTDWQQLKTKVRVPPDAVLIIAYFHCANGWRNTGEAYFDDVVLTTATDRTGSGAVSPLPAPTSGPAPVFDTAPASVACRRAYEMLPPVSDDGYTRPEIKNGTWYVNGKPEFYLGPWIYNRKHTDWNRNANPLKIDHIAYTTGPSREVFTAMGFNSAQISAAHTLPGQALYGLPIPADYQTAEALIADFYAGFKATPMVLDFAFGYHRAIRKADPVKYKELDQRNGGWHEFLPLCPEHPEGDRYYTDYFLGGVKAALKNQANIMVYELFNESAYNCACRFNARDFAGRMQRKYGTITQANKAWGTIFDNFGEVAAITHFQQYPRLWPDWCKFTAERYAEILKKYTAVIRTVDKRPRVYFTEQAVGLPPANPAMDYRLIADALDVLALEGGWRYGFSADPTAANQMEAVVVTGGSSHWFNCDFFQGLAKGKKPVINDEHYCTRMENLRRLPSRKSDMITSLWLELMHGTSANYTYCWDKRAFEYKTPEQARNNVIHFSYKSSSMLNPYNWPVSELDAFKIFEQELAPYKEQILPFPRTKPATVALFYSYPTLRMTPYHQVPFNQRMLQWYTALLHAQYPLRIVFDEDLRTLPKEIKTLVIPYADYTTPETAARVEAFIRKGGLVIADRTALLKDEYGNPRQSPAGKICRIDSDRPDTVAAIRRTLAGHRVKRYGTMTPADGGGALEMTDLQIIDRGDFKLVCLVGFGNPESRLATVRLMLDDTGYFYLSELVGQRLRVRKEKETWTTAELRDGFNLVLPPQERVLLTLERRRPANRRVTRPEEILTEFQQRRQREAAALEEFNRRRQEQQKDHTENRLYRNVPADRCRPVNLTGFVNMHFKDDIAGDRQGGWFDQGGNDFENMPTGRRLFAGVPFTIIDPAANNGKGVLVLYGTNRDYFPRDCRGVPVNLKARAIYFLHTMGWSAEGKVLSYLVHYADGSSREIPVRSGREIGGWWGTPRLSEAKIAVESSNRQHSPINLQCFRWTNPQPEKEIRTLDVISARSGAVPAVVAITVEEP